MEKEAKRMLEGGNKGKICGTICTPACSSTKKINNVSQFINYKRKNKINRRLNSSLICERKFWKLTLVDVLIIGSTAAGKSFVQKL